ncbi:C-type lectin domain family 4 member M-like [Amphibalanus amphitrite]|uniref:C-type lectin domain family 4 member M-like n=1 Tax=Amphibalanus amphitrite TaxID=1232801 RepID=UPI001C913E65|nr:C-type lectin domain family 4 member M-like [Amphibalanus amphitrite]
MQHDKCEALSSGECTGFIYGPDDGTCRLFSGDCRGPAVVSSQHTTERYMARDTCPGVVSDRCACPAGFSRCAGRCLKRLDHKVNYTEAESQCAALGAHLAVPRSNEENQCAMDATLGTNLWLGITDVVTEGQFVGADGCGTVSSSSPYWANGQPNNLNDQDYGLLAVEWPANGWHDVPAHAQHRPFCQLLACYQHGCQ